MFDRSTRYQVMRKSSAMIEQAGYYSKNPDILKQKLQQQKEKYVSIYEQFSGDATYIKHQVEELKTLTPQVKDLVVSTKEAFVDSKEEYKEIVNDTKEDIDAKKI